MFVPSTVNINQLKQNADSILMETVGVLNFLNITFFYCYELRCDAYTSTL